MDHKQFRLEIHLGRLQINSNRMLSNAKAIAILGQKEMIFPQTPELRRNIANFNQFGYFDKVELLINKKQKKYETQQLIIKLYFTEELSQTFLGQLSINLADLLNNKKFGIPLYYQIDKCYDCHANIRISIDFQLLNPYQKQHQQQIILNKEKQQQIIIPQNNSNLIDIKMHKELIQKANKQIKQLTYNLLQAQRQNQHYKLSNQKLIKLQRKILDQKIELVQQLDNSVIQIKQLKQKIQYINITRQQFTRINNINQNISLKNQQLIEQLNKKNIQLIAVIESKQKLIQVYQYVVQEKQKLTIQYDNLHKQCDILKHQNNSLKANLNYHYKRQQTKQKHYKQQQEKYIQKFLDSQHKKNTSLSQMQIRYQQKIQNLQKILKQTLKQNQQRLLQNNNHSKQETNTFRNKIQQLQFELEQWKLKNLKQQAINKQLSHSIEIHQKIIKQYQQKLKSKQQKIQQLQQSIKKYHTTISQKSQTIKNQKQELQTKKNSIDQLCIQLKYGSQTINQQNRKLQQLRNQIYLMKKNEEILLDKYNTDNNCKNKDIQYFKEYIKSLQYQNMEYQNKLNIQNDKLIQEIQIGKVRDQTINYFQGQLDKKKVNQNKIEKDKVFLQCQNQHLRRQLEQAISSLKLIKQQNILFERYLSEKPAKYKEQQFGDQKSQLKTYTQRNQQQLKRETMKQQIARMKYQTRELQNQDKFNNEHSPKSMKPIRRINY